VLAGSGVGLLAGTLGRLYASTWYALRDTRTPLKFAIVRVVLTVALGLIASLWAPRVLGVDPRWGVAGLTASAGVAAWVESYLLRRSLERRLGAGGVDRKYLVTLWGAAALAAIPALAVKWLGGPSHPVLVGVTGLSLYGAAYFAAAVAAGIPEAQAFWGRVNRLLGRRT
jgi:putative peptidoglycan lipid II flippase